jgi:hypothetical protein
VNRARAECESYEQNYGLAIPGNVLNDRMAAFMHMYTGADLSPHSLTATDRCVSAVYWTVRPFGCSALMGVNTRDGYELYQLTPDGVAYVSNGLSQGVCFAGASFHARESGRQTSTPHESGTGPSHGHALALACIPYASVVRKVSAAHFSVHRGQPPPAGSFLWVPVCASPPRFSPAAF